MKSPYLISAVEMCCHIKVSDDHRIDHSYNWCIHVEEGESLLKMRQNNIVLTVPVFVSGVLAALTKDWDRTKLFCLVFSGLSPSMM